MSPLMSEVNRQGDTAKQGSHENQGLRSYKRTKERKAAKDGQKGLLWEHKESSAPAEDSPFESP